MSSTESGQSRAAILMNAARRSHFVARIQKYEAKVREEQKRRALQKEKQKISMTLIEHHPNNWQSLESPLLPKRQLSMQEFITLPSNQHEKEGDLGSFVDTGHIGIVVDASALDQDSNGVLCCSPKRIHKEGARALRLSGSTPAETNLNPHKIMYITPKPSAPLDVNITDIAAALEVKIKKADMLVTMQEHAFLCARRCLKSTEKLMSKHTAYTLKTEFDKVYGPAWHCIVGRSFGSYVTHSVGGFIYFTFGKVSVLLFKTTVELVEHW